MALRLKVLWRSEGQGEQGGYNLHRTCRVALVDNPFNKVK